MQFSLETLALLGLTLASTTSAYLVTLYDSGDCTGPSTDLNVWDNTCATPGRSWNSAKVQVYGGSHQGARFHTEDACSADALFGPVWADGGDAGFQVGQCIRLGAGRIANAAGSFAA